MEIKNEIQHSILLERCSLILADAESARVKSDEQDNHFPPLTALGREGAWFRKISKQLLVMWQQDRLSSRFRTCGFATFPKNWR